MLLKWQAAAEKKAPESPRWPTMLASWLIVVICLHAPIAVRTVAANDITGATHSLNLDVPATPAQTEPRIAIVVGVSEYRDRQGQLSPLQYPARDAELLSQAFARHGYTVITLKNFEADAAYVLENIAQLDAPQTGTGSLVFAFSGHGFQRDGINYLAMGNTDLHRVRDTALSVRQVKLALSQTGFARRVLLIDACRNDPAKADPGIERRFAADTDSDGTAVMYSTAAGKLSYEDALLQQGVFSHYVARGLDGEARDERGNVTFGSLHAWVRQQVSSHVLSRFRRSQTPYIAGERSGEFLLARPHRSESLTANAQTPVPNTPGPANSLQPGSGWRRLAIALGVLAVAALVASSGSSGNTDSSPDAVTLVLPTP